MPVSRGGRRFALTVHVAASVGWLGAVIAFLGLAAVGVTSSDAATVRGTYLVMEPTARYVLVPLALAALGSGVVQSLVSPYGLLGHWWVIFKLGITVVATAVLLLYLETFRELRHRAASDDDLDLVRDASPLIHAAIASVLLIIATGLAIYKPKGMTPRGRRSLLILRSNRTLAPRGN